MKSKYLLAWLALALWPLQALADFAPVVPGRNFSFPRDHGAHPEFKTEWWYLTGHLEAPDERTFGFQWTVFRVGISAPESPQPANASPWRTRELYFGHLAISDLKAKKFYFGESAARGALEAAGSGRENFQVWLPGFRATPSDGRLQIQGQSQSIALDLSLGWPSAIALHGDSGYSQKSEQQGEASYYYSAPHLDSEGEVTIAGETFKVKGQAWMDHEFGSNQLGPEQSGWDWFGIPLPGKGSLMLYRLRHASDAAKDYLSGTYVDAEGHAHPLSKQDIQLSAEQLWQSPSGGAYPLLWRIKVPKYGIELQADADFPEQELKTEASTQVTYWEGSVSITGTVAGQTVKSRAYLEMTGYAKRFDKKI